jgi:hypothetical protein
MEKWGLHSAVVHCVPNPSRDIAKSSPSTFFSISGTPPALSILTITVLAQIIIFSTQVGLPKLPVVMALTSLSSNIISNSKLPS